MTAKEKFLRLARDRFKLAESADEEQRKREREDIAFYAGEQWSTDLLKDRSSRTIGSGSSEQTVPARPSLVINKTREPVRQVLNAERQSDLGIELVPADDFGEANGPIDHTEIELREGLVRRIQRDSEAADARTWAFARSAIAGRGYYRVMTRYVPGKSQDQEVYVERIYDQSSVLMDPSHEQADGSDCNWAFDGRDMLHTEAAAEYPEAKFAKVDTDDEWRALSSEAPKWFSGEGDKRSLRVMNYFYTDYKPIEVYHLSDGTAAYEDELKSLPPGVTVLTDDKGKQECHTELRKTIKWAKITGTEVLDETYWPGRWIPLLKVVGEELPPFDGQRRYEGIVRPMMDACKGNNYIISKFVERVGLTPIPPIMMAGGQDEGFEDEYNAINTRTLGRVHYNQKDQFDQPADPPFKLDSRADIADIGMGVQVFGQAIQATSVVPETALGNIDPTVKSGKMAKALIEQGERGTSNFLDNLVRSMRHEARIINDLLYPIYGARPGRMARMVNGQGEMSAVIIGQPFVMQGEGKQSKPVPAPEGQEGAKSYKLTKDADFNVAVKITVNAGTRRQQAAQFLGELIAASPEQMQIIGDKLWKYLDVPDHEEIEKRYKVMLAPPIQALLSGQHPMSPEAQAQIAQLTEQNQQLMELADKNKTDLEKVKLQEVAESERESARLAHEEEQNRADNETKLAVAELGAKVDRLALFLEERARLGVQQHEADMATDQRGHELTMADVSQQQALEQGEVGHQQTLEQAEQQASLQPEPVAE